MKNLYNPKDAAEIRARLQTLQPNSQRQWGKMSAPQAVAHCAVGLEMALGDRAVVRSFIGRLIGPMIKKKVVADDAPIRRNAPTTKEFIIGEGRQLDAERARLDQLISRFAAGPQACTTQPHAFFGPMQPDEWAILMYKHLDHHLRQFGV